VFNNENSVLSLSRSGEKSAVSYLESDLYLKSMAATVCDFRETEYQGAIFKELKAGAGL
jgi:hypothetical protein